MLTESFYNNNRSKLLNLDYVRSVEYDTSRDVILVTTTEFKDDDTNYVVCFTYERNNDVLLPGYEHEEAFQDTLVFRTITDLVIQLGEDHITSAALTKSTVKPTVRLKENGAVLTHEDVEIVFLEDLNLPELNVKELPERVQELIPANLTHTQYRVYLLTYEEAETRVTYQASGVPITCVTWADRDIVRLYAGCLEGAGLELDLKTGENLRKLIASSDIVYNDHINHKTPAIELVDMIDGLALHTNQSLLYAILPKTTAWGFIVTRDNLYVYQHEEDHRLLYIWLIAPKTDLFADYPEFLGVAFLQQQIAPATSVTTKLHLNDIARTLAGIHSTATAGGLRSRLADTQRTSALSELGNTNALKVIRHVLGPIGALAAIVELHLLSNQLKVSNDSSNASITIRTPKYKIKFTAVRKPLLTYAVDHRKDVNVEWVFNLFTVFTDQFKISRSLIGRRYYIHNDLGYTLLVEAIKQ